MSDERLFMLGDLALLAGGPAIVLFVLFYGFRSRWEATAAGRSVMALAASLASIYVLIAVTVVLGTEWELRGWARLVVFAATSTSMWVLFVNLLKAQHRGRHHS